MTAFPSPTLPADVANRLLAGWDKTNDELRSLLAVLTDRDFPQAESVEHARIVRRLAVISSALHGHIPSALTDGDRAWLETQGVPIGII